MVDTTYRDRRIESCRKAGMWPGSYKDIIDEKHFDDIVNSRQDHFMKKYARGYRTYWYTYDGMRAWIARGEKPADWQFWSQSWFQWVFPVVFSFSVVIGMSLMST